MTAIGGSLFSNQITDTVDKNLYNAMTEHWYCIYTKPKMEEHVSRRLTNIPDIDVFNPKLKRRTFRRGKLQEVTEELFPCYIFSRFNPGKYSHLIKYTRGVNKVLGDKSGNPFIVDEKIIDTIKSRIKDGFIELEMPDFQTGERVIIKEGMLKGLTGIFLKELHARERVLILLNTIAYQTSIEMEKGFLSRA